MLEKETLLKEIQDLEEKIKPKREQLNAIYHKEAEETEEKIRRCERLKDSFKLEELVYSAMARCGCGAGMAYPKTIGIQGSWMCGDILLGKASTDVQHQGAMPFAFNEIKSENQPSANGNTTRPK